MNMNSSRLRLKQLLAQKCDILVEYKEHKQRQRKRCHEEIAEDEAVFNARKKS